MNDFEQKISRQPLRKIPGEWRAEILTACGKTKVENRTPKQFGLSAFNTRLANIFWPSPKAWAALAAIWIFIFVLNFSMRDRSPVTLEKYSPPSPEVLVELKKQQLFFAELMDAREAADADRPKFYLARPRSEYAEILKT